MDPRHRRGRQAEDRAAAWLQADGWTILARNQRVAGVEVDLIAARDRRVRFVEVKARRHGTPAEEAVSARQLGRLRHAGDAWLIAHTGWEEGAILLVMVDEAGEIGWVEAG